MKIFVLADGTWLSNDSGLQSNISKLKSILKGSDEYKVIYQSGVGTNSNLLLKLINGSVALDIDNKIKGLYKQLILSYKPGDIIHFIGYSRGAYIVRCLAGMIYNCGLPSSKQIYKTSKITFVKSKSNSNIKVNIDLLINRAYYVYRNRNISYHPNSKMSREFKECWSDKTEIEIDLMCCFDTVGSLGIPSIPLLNLPSQYRFFNTNINKNVKYALHLLAKDENRVVFNPTLMTKSDNNNCTVIDQYLYKGDHSTIGGIDPRNLYLSKLPLYYLYELLNLKFDKGMPEWDIYYPEDINLFNFICIFIGGIKARNLNIQ